MSRERENPMCKHHGDCFALLDGGCTILKNTNFKTDCPFYKHKDEVDTKQIEEDIKNYKAGR